MPARSFDVVILGGGNAGMGVTVATREAGLKVAMIEPDLLGGTCPNRGCMPKKVLVAAAHALDEIERAKAHHIHIGKPSLDWAALIDRETAMISGIPASLGELMNRRGVEVIRDHGRFAGPNAVAVGGETLEAKHIVIATGSTPRRQTRRSPAGCARVQPRLCPGGRQSHDPRGVAAVARKHGCGCGRTTARRDRTDRSYDPDRGRDPADRASSGQAPRRLSGGRIGTHSLGRARSQRSGTRRKCRWPRPCRR